MRPLKPYFVRAISFGIHPLLSEEKKLAIQLSTLDGYWTFLTIFAYLVYTVASGRYPLYLFHAVSLLLVAIGIYCYYLRRYDLGRYLVNIVGLTEVFLTADAAKPNVGHEFYYLTAIAVPFIIFTHEERLKGALLTLISTSVFIIQQIYGTGLFLEVMETAPEERIVAVLFVVSYFYLSEKWVEIEVRETENSIQLMVTDSGSGIKESIAEKIMMPFFTTKGPQLGTGLGLSISQSIVKKHGGILFYDRSYPNTRFVIELPSAYLR